MTTPAVVGHKIDKRTPVFPILKNKDVLILVLLFAVVSAYTVVTQWEDIVWEVAMRSKYELRDIDGNVVPDIILEAEDSNYKKVYSLTNIVAVPYNIVGFRGIPVGVQYQYYFGRISPNEIYTIQFWVRDSLSHDTIIEVRLLRVKNK